MFEQNPKLSDIGNQQQYSNYLESVFPNSQVKQIVTHFSLNQFDKFDLILVVLKYQNNAM